jgi:hypothetical protein
VPTLPFSMTSVFLIFIRKIDHRCLQASRFGSSYLNKVCQTTVLAVT